MLHRHKVLRAVVGLEVRTLPANAARRGPILWIQAGLCVDTFKAKAASSSEGRGKQQPRGKDMLRHCRARARGLLERR